MQTAKRWKHMRQQWAVLTYYQRFEGFVALILTVLIGMVILIALYRLSVSALVGLVFGMLDPLDPKAFQLIFGEVLTLLIALEFNHTLQYVVTREQSIIQTIALVPGGTYWLMRERDDRLMLNSKGKGIFGQNIA